MFFIATAGVDDSSEEKKMPARYIFKYFVQRKIMLRHEWPFSLEEGQLKLPLAVSSLESSSSSSPVQPETRPFHTPCHSMPKQVRSDDGPRRLSTVPGAPPPSSTSAPGGGGGGGSQGSSSKRPPRNRFVWLGPTRRRVVGLGPGEATTIPLKVRQEKETGFDWGAEVEVLGCRGWPGLAWLGL